MGSGFPGSVWQSTDASYTPTTLRKDQGMAANVGESFKRVITKEIQFIKLQTAFTAELNSTHNKASGGGLWYANDKA